VTTIKLRRGTASEWKRANPVLAAGEPGFETDTGTLKVGDGTTTWSHLPHFVLGDEAAATASDAVATSTGITRPLAKSPSTVAVQTNRYQNPISNTTGTFSGVFGAAPGAGSVDAPATGGSTNARAWIRATFSTASPASQPCQLEITDVGTSAIPCKAGESLYVAQDVVVSWASPMTLLQVNFYNASGRAIDADLNGDATTLVPLQWTRISFSFTVPDTAAFMRFHVAHDSTGSTVGDYFGATATQIGEEGPFFTGHGIADSFTSVADQSTSQTYPFTTVVDGGTRQFDLTPWVNGDGMTDDTANLRNAITAALAGGNRVLYARPDLTCLVSGSINLSGLSLVSPGGFTLKAALQARPSNFRFPEGRFNNDVAILYAVGHDGWHIEGVNVDCSDIIVKGMTAWGGTGIRFMRNSVRNSGSAAFQMMGARTATDAPIVASSMVGNTAYNSKWSYVADGNHVGTLIANNLSYNAVMAHVSVDPNESQTMAYAEVSIVDNVLYGRRDQPPGWFGADDPYFHAIYVLNPASPPNYATKAQIIGNKIIGWHTTTPSLTTLAAIRCLWLDSAIISNNEMRTFSGEVGPVAIGLLSCRNVRISDNISQDYRVGIEVVNDLVTNTRGRDNIFVNATTKYTKPLTGYGAGIQFIEGLTDVTPH
jgi:hypothetical protein